MSLKVTINFQVKQCLPVTLEFQIQGEGGINGEAGKFRPK